jgi:hypothetical protein
MFICCQPTLKTIISIQLIGNWLLFARREAKNNAYENNNNDDDDEGKCSGNSSGSININGGSSSQPEQLNKQVRENTTATMESISLTPKCKIIISLVICTTTKRRSLDL